MILIYLLIGLIGQTNAGDPTKHLTTLLKHTQLQFKSIFATTNTRQLLEEISTHDIQCHRKPTLLCQKALIQSNKKLLKRISQSDMDLKITSSYSSLLFNYVIWGLPERVQLALSQGFNPNSLDDKGNTPLIYALDQYALHKYNNMEKKAADFKIIIQDLLHHGAIIFGNTQYSCPHTFAKKYGLTDCIGLFEEIQERRIKKTMEYLNHHGYDFDTAKAVASNLITQQVNFMTLSSKERTELIVQDLHKYNIDKQKSLDIAHSNHSQLQESLDQ